MAPLETGGIGTLGNIMMKLCRRLVAIGLLGAAAAAMAQAPASTAVNDDAIYRGLGGKAGIAAISHGFLAAVQRDVRVNESFQDFDLEQLDTRLQVFLCEYSGGPCQYTGQFRDKTMDGVGTVRDMHSVHSDLKVTDLQFDAVAGTLRQVMRDAGVAAGVQDQLLARLAPLRREIVDQ